MEKVNLRTFFSFHDKTPHSRRVLFSCRFPFCVVVACVCVLMWERDHEEERGLWIEDRQHIIMDYKLHIPLDSIKYTYSLLSMGIQYYPSMVS